MYSVTPQAWMQYKYLTLYQRSTLNVLIYFAPLNRRQHLKLCMSDILDNQSPFFWPSLKPHPRSNLAFILISSTHTCNLVTAFCTVLTLPCWHKAVHKGLKTASEVIPTKICVFRTTVAMMTDTEAETNAVATDDELVPFSLRSIISGVVDISYFSHSGLTRMNHSQSTNSVPPDMSQHWFKANLPLSCWRFHTDMRSSVITFVFHYCTTQKERCPASLLRCWVFCRYRYCTIPQSGPLKKKKKILDYQTLKEHPVLFWQPHLKKCEFYGSENLSFYEMLPLIV